MWVIDGQQSLGQLDGWSRAVQFADGLFETMVIKSGDIQGIKQHVARMTLGLERLDIPTPFVDPEKALLDYAHQFIELSGFNSGILKVIVSRGDSQRGYAYDGTVKPSVTAFYNQLPELNAAIYQTGVALKSLVTQCAIQPQIAGMKHLNRLENVLAKKELSADAFEGLMYNHLDYVIEGISSNVFFEHNNHLITPNLNLSGVAGVMRECVLEFALKNKIQVKITDIPRDQLAQFDRGFICNSVMGIVPISSLDDRMFELSPVTKTIQDAWEDGVIYA